MVRQAAKVRWVTADAGTKIKSRERGVLSDVLITKRADRNRPLFLIVNIHRDGRYSAADALCRLTFYPTGDFLPRQEILLLARARPATNF